MSDYWKETIESALLEAELTATDEQMEIMAGVVEGCHENYGMVHGHDCIPNPLKAEIERINSSHEQRLKETEMELKAVKDLALRARGLNKDDAYVSVQYGQAHFERIR